MFSNHTKETAPVDSQPQIKASIATFGFLSKLHPILAPATYEIGNTAFN